MRGTRRIDAGNLLCMETKDQGPESGMKFNKLGIHVLLSFQSVVSFCIIYANGSNYRGHNVISFVLNAYFSLRPVCYQLELLNLSG